MAQRSESETAKKSNERQDADNLMATITGWRPSAEFVYDQWATTETGWKTWDSTDAAEKWIKSCFDEDDHSKLTSLSARAAALVRCGKAVKDLYESLLDGSLAQQTLNTQQMRWAQVASLWQSAQQSLTFVVSGKQAPIELKSSVQSLADFSPPVFLNGAEYTAVKNAFYVATVSAARQQNVRHSDTTNTSVNGDGGGSFSFNEMSRSVGQAPPKKRVRLSGVSDPDNSPFGLPPHASEQQPDKNADQV